MLIRTEAPADILVIDRLLKTAFETPAEANLVMALRENSQLTLSVVACSDDGEVIGHVMFSPVSLDGEMLSWQGLAPLAVLPEHQGKGVAHALIREGLTMLGELGYPVVVTLGNPVHYQSAGFTTAADKGFRCVWPVPAEAFMIHEILPDHLAGKQGLIEYSDEFNQL